MDKSEIKAIQSLSCEERYDVFLHLVAQEREIWVLVNKDKQVLNICSEESDLGILPVWPHADFTTVYRDDKDDSLEPKAISLPEFFAKWIPGLEGDDLQVGVFPNSGSDVWIMEPSELKEDLQDELSASF